MGDLRIIEGLNDVKIPAAVLIGWGILSNVLLFIPIVNMVTCLLLPLGLLIGFGIPIYMGYLLASKRYELVEGAVVPAIVGLISSIINSVIHLAGGLLGLTVQVGKGMMSGSDVSSAMLSGAMGMGIDIVCMVGGILWGVIISAVLGVIGYFAYGLINKR